MKGRRSVMKTKLIIVRAYDKTAEWKVKKAINELGIEVVEEITVRYSHVDILTKMTHEQALAMLDVVNSTDAVMIKGEE